MIEMKRTKKKSARTLWLLLLLLAAVVALILLLPGCGHTDQMEKTTLAKKGTQAPDFTVTMIDGGQTTLSELRGKVVLLNFWATWCPPCRQELARLQTDIIDRFADQEFVLLPISRGEERSQVESFLAGNGYDFPVGLDPEQTIYTLYATNYIPRNFLIDRTGKIVLTSVGYEPREFDELIDIIRKTLKQEK